MSEIPGIMNYFSTNNVVDRVHAWGIGPGARSPTWTDGGADRRHRSAVARSPEYGLRPLRCTKAHRRGCNRDRGALGARLRPHRSSGSFYRAGGGVPARKRRREGLGDVWGDPGVVGVAFIGPGEGTGGRVAGVMEAMNSH
jgi:hypothetical protein